MDPMSRVWPPDDPLERLAKLFEEDPDDEDEIPDDELDEEEEEE
jgi:hypothetical protein